MRLKIIAVLILFLLLLSSCQTTSRKYIPKSNKADASSCEKIKNSKAIKKPTAKKYESHLAIRPLAYRKPKRIFYKNKVVVITYHHISRLPFSSITITPERFEKDMRMLVQKQFNVISIREMINCLSNKSPIPENAIVITFDDGIESYYKYAYPIMKKMRLPSVNFIITGRVQGYTPSKNDFNPLSREEIEEMFKSGIVDIQSHTARQHEQIVIDKRGNTGSKLTHRLYDEKKDTYESATDYETRIRKDLLESKSEIRKYVGKDTDILCFPFGSYNTKTLEIARECGFKYYVTTEKSINKGFGKVKKIYRLSAGERKKNSFRLFNEIIASAN